MSSFISILQYKIRSDKRIEFEKLYGQNGDWVKLFSKYPGYIKTELIKDLSNDDNYLTLDYWKSKESYYNFKEKSQKEYSELEKKGEELTLEEKLISNAELII